MYMNRLVVPPRALGHARTRAQHVRVRVRVCVHVHTRYGDHTRIRTSAHHVSMPADIHARRPGHRHMRYSISNPEHARTHTRIRISIRAFAFAHGALSVARTINMPTRKRANAPTRMRAHASAGILRLGAQSRVVVSTRTRAHRHTLAHTRAHIGTARMQIPAGKHTDIRRHIRKCCARAAM